MTWKHHSTIGVVIPYTSVGAKLLVSKQNAVVWHLNSKNCDFRPFPNFQKWGSIRFSFKENCSSAVAHWVLPILPRLSHMKLKKWEFQQVHPCEYKANLDVRSNLLHIPEPVLKAILIKTYAFRSILTVHAVKWKAILLDSPMSWKRTAYIENP